MANKLRSDYEKQEDHKYLYQVVYDDAQDIRSQYCLSVVYGKKYVYKSTLDSQVGNRLIMVTCKNPSLVSSHLPFKLQAQQNKMDNALKIQEEIDLNSQFGRLLCAILFYQGFEKSFMIISEKHELAKCVFRSDSNKFSSSQILASLAMSIIEREYNRGSLEFQSSGQLVKQASNVIGKVNNIAGKIGHEADQNHWLYLLIQSLYQYINSRPFICFPCCNCTNEAKQRHKLKEILADLLSLSTHEIPKNKTLYPTVEMMRLQSLAKLQFPASDTREHCVRQIIKIQMWKEEQKN
jgi:hypothetical protein